MNKEGTYWQLPRKLGFSKMSQQALHFEILHLTALNIANKHSDYVLLIDRIILNNIGKIVRDSSLRQYQLSTIIR
jgi:hypothetical protein